MSRKIPRNRIYYFRRLRGLKQGDLGKLMGVSRITVGLCERHDIRITDRLIPLFCKALNVSRETLFG